jgi:YhcH/YjgK/YiaL family protein
MILDTHDNLQRYAKLFRTVDPAPLFAWLADCRAVEPGTKVEFAGDKLFARVLRQDTGARDAFRWETHREYIDLQFILGGGEMIEWRPASELSADVAYDESTDFQFYAPAEGEVFLPMHDGLFVFLFPEDAHKPLVGDGTNSFVHKVIAKIHRSLLVV